MVHFEFSLSLFNAIHTGGRGLVRVVTRRRRDEFVHPEAFAALVDSDELDPQGGFSLARHSGSTTCNAILGVSCLSIHLVPAPKHELAYDWEGIDLTGAARVVREVLAAAGIRAEPWVISEGDGLRLFFPHEHLPAKAAPRWRAVQAALARRLKTIGGETGTGMLSFVPFPSDVVQGARCGFEDLADLLPRTRAACRAPARIERLDARGGTAGNLWKRRLDDILEFSRRTSRASSFEQQRRILWIAANALGWFIADSAMATKEAWRLTRELFPALKPFSRIQLAQAVLHTSPTGFPSRRRLMRFSERQIGKFLTHHLGPWAEVIWTEIQKRSMTERQKRRGERSGIRRRQKTRLRDARILEMAANKMSYSEIAHAMGVSKATVGNVVSRKNRARQETCANLQTEARPPFRSKI